jgi:serine/threonine protein kinase
MAPVHDLNYIHRDIKPENIILAPIKTLLNEDKSDAINPN